MSFYWKPTCAIAIIKIHPCLIRFTLWTSFATTIDSDGDSYWRIKTLLLLLLSVYLLTRPDNEDSLVRDARPLKLEFVLAT